MYVGDSLCMLNGAADAGSQILDVKGADAKNPDGIEGSLSVTTLRLIFTSKKNAAVNMSVGHRSVTKAYITTLPNESILTVCVTQGDKKFEILWKSKDATPPACFHSALRVYR